MLKRPQYWVPTRDKSQYDRRTMYMIYKRNLRLPFVEVFDAPDTLLSCARREQSTHAPQALELLNGQTSNELAAVFARAPDEGARDGRGTGGPRVAAGGGPFADSGREGAGDGVFEGARGRSGKLKEFALAVFNLNAFVYVN